MCLSLISNNSTLKLRKTHPQLFIGIKLITKNTTIPYIYKI